MHRASVQKMAEARRRQPDICKYASPSVFKDELYTRLKGAGILDAAKVRLLRLMLTPELLCCYGRAYVVVLLRKLYDLPATELTFLQCELRKRILDHFRRDLGAAPEKARPASIQEYMVNTLIAEYLGARAHTCTLSVFLPEVSLSDSAVLTHDDILAMLQIRPGTHLYGTIHNAMTEEKENRTS